VVIFPSVKRQQALLYLTLATINLICFFLIWNTQRAVDYRAFYSAGRLANESLRAVYDTAAQRSVLPTFSGEKGWLPYYHPPHELLIFAPLARLPYALSFAVWNAMGLGFVLAATKLLSLSFNLEWKHTAVVAFAIFATVFSFYEGQDTLLLVFLLAAALFLLHRNLESYAAVVLALALFKPQIPAVVALALLLSGRRRFFFLFVACSLTIAVASFLAIGTDGFHQWLSLIRSNEAQEQPWRMMSLRGLLSLLDGSHAFAAAAAGALFITFASRWRRAQNLSLSFSSAIVVGSLTAFHFHAYDAAVLLIPLTYLMSTSELNWLDYSAIVALCVSPLFFALTMIEKSALLCIPVLILSARFWACLKAQNSSAFCAVSKQRM
jgi:hypothetical protein